MSWGLGTTLIGQGLGITPEITILMITSLGCLVFFAKDFILGVILFFFNATLNFMLDYYFEVNYAPALILMFLSFIVMSMSLYVISQSSAQGGYV